MKNLRVFCDIHIWKVLYLWNKNRMKKIKYDLKNNYLKKFNPN